MGLRGKGVWFEGWGLKFMVQDLGLRVYGLRFKVSGLPRNFSSRVTGHPP